MHKQTEYRNVDGQADRRQNGKAGNSGCQLP
jgi:hypothetical protein